MELKKDQCKEKVTTYNLNWPTYHQCKRKAVKDGYCNQHHPDNVNKRKEEKIKRWEEKQKQSPIYKLQKAVEKIKALEKEIERLKNKLKAKDRSRDELIEMAEQFNDYIL